MNIVNKTIEYTVPTTNDEYTMDILREEMLAINIQLGYAIPIIFDVSDTVVAYVFSMFFANDTTVLSVLIEDYIVCNPRELYTHMILYPLCVSFRDFVHTVILHEIGHIYQYTHKTQWVLDVYNAGTPEQWSNPKRDLEVDADRYALEHSSNDEQKRIAQMFIDASIVREYV